MTCSPISDRGCEIRAGPRRNGRRLDPGRAADLDPRGLRATGPRATTGAAGEARLNRFAQFTTEIDGLDIHFLHVRSPHPDAMPLIITHGWPGSVVEFQKVIEPLTNPTAHGGDRADAFHVVCPSLPGLRLLRQADRDRLGR